MVKKLLKTTGKTANSPIVTSVSWKGTNPYSVLMTISVMSVLSMFNFVLISTPKTLQL